MPKSYGLIIEPLKPEDYVFGGQSKLSGEVINPSGDWLPYIPLFEHQAPGFETNSCVTHGTLNAFEALNKLIYGEEPNLSDRFLAVTSGTDWKGGGNSPQRVAEAFRKAWSCFEEDYPRHAASVEDFYKEIPDLLYSKARIVKGNNTFGYEAIQNPTKLKLQEALTKGAVGISVFAWTQDENGLYFKPQGFTDNHWVWLLKVKQNGNYLIFDSYDPSIKEIRADFLPQIAYRYTLNEERIDPIVRAINAIKELLARLLSTPKPEPKPAPANNYLNAFCLEIQRHEGWYRGSRSYRNNNPGNIVYVGQPGATKEKDGRFAVFPTYEAGFNALKTMVLNAATGKSKIYRPNMNLYEYFAIYAPDADNNNSRHYAETVAKALSVSPETFLLSQLA